MSVKRYLIERIVKTADDQRPEGSGWELVTYNVQDGVKTHVWERELKRQKVDWDVRRSLLKKAGWKRQDFVGAGECWYAPQRSPLSMHAMGVSLRTAWTRYQKEQKCEAQRTT